MRFLKLFSGPILGLLLSTLISDGGVVMNSYLYLLGVLLILVAALALRRKVRGLLFGPAGRRMPAVLAVLSGLAFVAACVFGQGIVEWINR